VPTCEGTHRLSVCSVVAVQERVEYAEIFVPGVRHRRERARGTKVSTPPTHLGSCRYLTLPPRGFGLSFNSHLYHEVPNPNLTIRNCIAEQRGSQRGGQPPPLDGRRSGDGAST
jgi:hypothetical protein